MGVSLVRVGDSRERVGDSRERGRGRGQGVSAINGHWPPSPTDTEETKTNKHALRPLLLLREKKTTLPPFCFEEQKTHTIAAISAGEQRLITQRRHFAGEHRHKLSPPFCCWRTKTHIA